MRRILIQKILSLLFFSDQVNTFYGSVRKVTLNTAWMLVSEGFARASRFITIIVMATALSSIDYGIAMLALVCHELLRTFTRIGSGSKIIQCSQEKLGVYTGNAYTLNWIIAFMIASLQFLVAPNIASYYNSPALSSLLRLMAISYLIYPWVAIKVYLLQRENRMKVFSLCNAAAISADNLGTALLLSLGIGIYAIAYAKIFAALVWVVGFKLAKTDTIKPQFSPTIQITLVHFSSRVLGSELLKALRGQIDILLAGRLLAPEIFGLYSFSKSAGVGLAQSLSNAFLVGVYPRLADFYRNATLLQGKKIIFGIAIALSLIFILQSLAATIYIPLLFDEKWHSAATLVSILCLSAIPAIMLDTAALIQRVQYHLNGEMLLQFISVISLGIGLLLTTPKTATEFALYTTTFSLTWILFSIFSIYTRFNTSIQGPL